MVKKQMVMGQAVAGMQALKEFSLVAKADEDRAVSPRSPSRPLPCLNFVLHLVPFYVD